MNLTLKRGFFSGLVILVMGIGINMGIQVLFPSIAFEYQNTALFRPFSDPLMMIFFAYPFVFGMVAAYLWEKLSKPKPAEFAKIYFLIATIPGMFATFTSFNISLAMVLVWTFTGYIEALAAGYVFARVKK